MTDYSKITALYSRLSVGDEDRDGGESNSIQNQKIFLENYARGQHLTNIRHYIDDDESGRFFDRSAYSRMMDDVENGKIGVCIMKDLTRWGRDYLQVGNAMEIFRRNNVRFIAVNNGIDSEKPDTLEFAPFINIMSEWYAKDISLRRKPVYQGDLDDIEMYFMAAVKEIKKSIGSHYAEQEAMSKKVAEKMFTELTKGRDVQHPTITAEQLADAMLDSVSGMEGATPEALEQLRNGLLGILQSAAEQENAHEADE